jgi:hypothetical protein
VGTIKQARAVVSHPAVLFAAPLVIIGLGGYLGNVVVTIDLKMVTNDAKRRKKIRRQWRGSEPSMAENVEDNANAQPSTQSRRRSNHANFADGACFRT